MENLGAIREQFIALNKKKSNADRIRARSDEELAEFLETLCPSYNWTLALNGLSWLDWLRQEAGDGETP